MVMVLICLSCWERGMGEKGVFGVILGEWRYCGV